MSASPKIPKGWRKLRVGEVIEDGDLFDYIGETNLDAWGTCAHDGGGCRIGKKLIARDYPRVIRRVARAKGKGRG